MAERYTEWQDRIEELDAGGFEVSKSEADFLENLMEHQPPVLSARQVAWLEDMCRKYGVS